MNDFAACLVAAMTWVAVDAAFAGADFRFSTRADTIRWVNFRSLAIAARVFGEMPSALCLIRGWPDSGSNSTLASANAWRMSLASGAWLSRSSVNMFFREVSYVFF